ncbi:tetratricopeptide repeat protein [Pseudomonas sp. TWP3-1]|uniref:tetratricopeptide repeat protein n=1 Tax=Pseudomonas sp. TWP3-1 TaxID=2804631 RepID=UPI003CEED124
MLDKKQSQSTGDQCLAIQAGRDAVVNVGYTASEVEGIVQAGVIAVSSRYEAQMESLRGDKLFVEEQLRSAIKALALKTTDSNEEDASKLKYEKALKLVKEGDTLEAENLFLDIEMSEQKNIASSTKKIVDAALHRGALAFMRDTSSSMSAFEKVLELEPENLVAKQHLARLFMRVGKYIKSENLYLQILSVAKEKKDDGWKGSAYHALGQVNFCKGNLGKSLEMQNRAMEVMQGSGDFIGAANVLLEMANIYVGQEDFVPAKNIVEKLLKLAITLDDEALIARSHAVKGVIYSKLNIYGVAEESFLLSLNYCKKMENLEGVAEAHGNLGILYKNKGELSLAEEMYAISLEIEKKLSRKSGVISDLVNIANLLNKKGEHEMALTKCLEALEMSREINSVTTRAIVHASLGGIYISKEEYLLARKCYEISYGCEKQAGNAYGEAKQLTNLATTHFAVSENKQGLALLKKAKIISKKYGHSDLIKKINNRIAIIQK